MQYNITVKGKVQKAIRKLPARVQDRFEALAVILQDSGPTGPHAWMNYSKLSIDTFHCHLDYRHVACWRCVGQSIEIEVYHVGSRESAPY